jgi:lipooligosaccharide transport system ATP-binding protein
LYTHDGDGVAAAIQEHELGAAAVLVRRASLEDVFLILTGRTLEEA